MRGVRCCWMRIVRAILFIVGGSLSVAAVVLALTLQDIRSADMVEASVKARWEGAVMESVPDPYSTALLVTPIALSFAGLSLQAVAMFAGGASRERPAHGHRSVA